MPDLTVFSYFCPDAQWRPGGVQQVVGPLLQGLTDQHSWNLNVLHYGDAPLKCDHVVVPNIQGAESDHIDTDALVTSSQMIRESAESSDVVLSIDRSLPASIRAPRVLMSNSAAYFTEASAVAMCEWSAVVVPTRSFERRVAAINPLLAATVVPYGLPDSTLDRLLAMPTPNWHANDVTVLCPHRPDSRKGHVALLEGVARRSPGITPVRLVIAWLDEERYRPFRLSLDRLAALLGIADRVTFVPWSGADTYSNTLAAAHAVLQLGTFEETFGLAAFEAALAGRIAMTRTQPAVREVLSADFHHELPNETDWRAALHTVICQCRRYPDEHTRQNRRILASSFRLDRMVDAYDALLRSAAGIARHR